MWLRTMRDETRVYGVGDEIMPRLGVQLLRCVDVTALPGIETAEAVQIDLEQEHWDNGAVNVTVTGIRSMGAEYRVVGADRWGHPIREIAVRLSWANTAAEQLRQLETGEMKLY